jgi:hypothetical protein
MSFVGTLADREDPMMAAADNGGGGGDGECAWVCNLESPEEPVSYFYEKRYVPGPGFVGLAVVLIRRHTQF